MQANLSGKAGSITITAAPRAPANGSSSSISATAAANGSSIVGGKPPAGGVDAYEKLLQEQLKPFMDQATALGGEVCVRYCTQRSSIWAENKVMVGQPC